jgi:hypothetical protein
LVVLVLEHQLQGIPVLRVLLLLLALFHLLAGVTVRVIQQLQRGETEVLVEGVEKM